MTFAGLDNMQFNASSGANLINVTTTAVCPVLLNAAVVLKYTYAGDANLEGTIDGGNSAILDNFAQIPRRMAITTANSITTASSTAAITLLSTTTRKRRGHRCNDDVR